MAAMDAITELTYFRTVSDGIIRLAIMACLQLDLNSSSKFNQKSLYVVSYNEKLVSSEFLVQIVLVIF